MALNSKMNRTSIVLTFLLLLAILIAVSWWFFLKEEPLIGIASGNGRIEATEIDIATKYQGRVEQIFVEEGELVSVNQTAAIMDTRSIKAQLSQAEAKILEAKRERINAEFIGALIRFRKTVTLTNL